LKWPHDQILFWKLCADSDSFMRHAAVQQMSRMGLVKFPSKLFGPQQRIHQMLAWRASANSEALKYLPAWLTDPDEEVRFLAAKWIADEKLVEFRPQVVQALK